MRASELEIARANGGTVSAERPILEIEHMHKAFLVQGTPSVVLQDVMLNVHEGEFVSLIGPSGCGKTTVLRAVAGFSPASSGQVLLKGEPVTQNTGGVGVVFQSPNLLPWLTASQNVELALKQFGVRDKSERKDRAAQSLGEVGLGGALKKYPAELSGGMQQRVGIARALAHDPDVLLMDEPFGALDAITREQLDFQLLDFWEAKRRTVLFVTHSIEEAVLLSDRVICMKPNPGEVVADHRVSFSRPRTIEQLSDPAFIEEVREVRSYIDSYYEDRSSR